MINSVCGMIRIVSLNCKTIENNFTIADTAYQIHAKNKYLVRGIESANEMIFEN